MLKSILLNLVSLLLIGACSLEVPVAQPSLELKTQTKTSLPTSVTLATTLIRIVATPTPSGSETPSNTTILACESSITPISSTSVSKFIWSKDSQTAYYATNKWYSVWLAFEIIARNSRSVSKDELDLLLKLTAQERATQEMWTTTKEREWNGIYYSPKGDKAIYIKETEEGDPKPPGSKIVHQDIYLQTDLNGHREYLGKTEGEINDAIWSQDGKKVILTAQEYMSYAVLSPYHFWIVGIDDKSLTPTFKRDEQTKIQIKGISPDGNRIVYNLVKPMEQEQFLQILDVRTGSEKVINLSATTVNYSWPMDEDRLMILTHGSYGEDDFVYLYFQQSGKLLQVVHKPFISNPWTKSAVLLSPDSTKILFVSESDLKLNVVNLCY